MAGLLTAIGGTLAGVGQGLTQQAEEDGKAKREARLAELQHGYRMDENKAQNDFTAGQNDLNRQQQTRENQLTRENTLENTRLQGANQLANTAAQGANTQANTRLTSELQTQRDVAGADRTAQRDAKLHEYDVENENVRSGNRIKEDRAKGESSGASKEVQAEFDRLNEAYKDKPKVLREMLANSRFPELRRLVDNSPATSPFKPGAAETPAPAASAPSASPQTGNSSVARPSTAEEFSALPKGTLFVNPADGKTYRKN